MASRKPTGLQVVKGGAPTIHRRKRKKRTIRLAFVPLGEGYALPLLLDGLAQVRLAKTVSCEVDADAVASIEED